MSGDHQEVLDLRREVADLKAKLAAAICNQMKQRAEQAEAELQAARQDTEDLRQRVLGVEIRAAALAGKGDQDGKE